MKKTMYVPVALLTSVMMGVPAFAAVEGPTPVAFADWQAVLTSMTGQISPSTVVGVIAATIGAGIGLVFMWWGVRKLVSSLMAAFRRGKLSV